MGLALLLTLSVGGSARADEPLPPIDGAAEVVTVAHLAVPGESPRRPSLLAPLVAGTLSLASVAAGGGLLVDATVRFPGLADRCDGSGCVVGDITPLQQRVYAGYGLIAVGTVGTAIALIDLALAVRRGPRPAGVPRVLLVPSPGGLAAVGRF